MTTLFKVSTVVLVVTAVVLLGQGVHSFEEVGLLPSRPMPFFRVEVLGIYPDRLSVLVQLLVGAAPLVWKALGRRSTSGAQLDPETKPGGIIAVCVACFLALNLLSVEGRAELMDIVAPRALQIWRGAAWGLATSAFVHLAVWHIGFNMWWARDFGRLMEPAMGAARYLGFVLAAAVVSSAWQLLVSGETGIGFSGVVYAMFGWVVARRRSSRAYAAFANRATVLWMLGWLVLCIVLTLAHVWAVGNGAHVAGLAFGWILGTAFERPKLRPILGVAGALLLAGVVLSVAYMPWSPAWQARHGLPWNEGVEP